MDAKNEENLIRDLVEISRKKEEIEKTLVFVRNAHKKYILRHRRNRIRLLAIALPGAAAILLLSLVLFPSFLALDGSSKYHEFYKRFDSQGLTRDTGTRNALNEAFSFYEQGQLLAAVSITDSLMLHQPEHSKLVFLRALIEIERDQPDQAIKMFYRVLPLGGAYEGYSRWYIALIYLRQNNFSACREQLVALKKMDDNPNKKEVNSLYRLIRFRKNLR